MAEYQQNSALERESQQPVQHQLEQRNENPVANSSMAAADSLKIKNPNVWLTQKPSIHGHFFSLDSIGHYLINNPMPLDELMRKQYHPGYLWYNLDPFFSRLKIVSKEWHQTLTSDIRIKMMYKVCKGIFPKTQFIQYFTDVLEIMAANARVFEGEVYAMANSISEYYNLLDDRIYIIQNNIDTSLCERRRERNKQQLAQQQQQPKQQQQEQEQEQENKNLVANLLVPLIMAGGLLNSKSPDMQSPQNVSVSKNVDDQQMIHSLGNFPTKKQSCDEKDFDNLESPDSEKDSDNSESSDSETDSDDLELSDYESFDREESIEIELGRHQTITPDLRVPKTKKWHQTVTLRLRIYIINQILVRLFPQHYKRKWFDNGSYNIYAFARRVEADIYEMANSKSEYYQLLAEKMYELEDNREEELKKSCNVQQPLSSSEPSPRSQSSISTTPTGGGLNAENDLAFLVQENNEWHQSVTPDSRSRLVFELVRKLLFRSPDTQAIVHKSLHDFIEYIKQIESDIYKMANSRSEYYHLMDDTDYKIQQIYMIKHLLKNSKNQN